MWRQDHNGFTHQDPGFIDLAGMKSGDVVRVYMPADANGLLAVACAGDIPTLRIRVINVDKLFALSAPKEHPHGLIDRDFDNLFTTDRPVIFNFHGYPWLIHRHIYRRTNHAKFHVRDYKEKDNINTPPERAMNNLVGLHT